MKKNLYIFTGTFPYDGAAEGSFINLEINSLVESGLFNVIVFPGSLKGKKYDIHPDCVVENSFVWYSQLPFIQKIIIPLKYLFTLFFWQTFIKYGRITILPHNFINYAIQNARYSFLKKKFSAFIENNDIDLDNSIFYTFWFSTDTKALSRIKSSQYPNMKLITRAHGSDLYEYIDAKFFRNKDIEIINNVYTVSDFGREYLSELYPKYKDKFKVGKIGTLNLEPRNIFSQDSKIRVVSCSSLIPLKQVNRILDSLQTFASTKKIQLEWTHFGDGSERSEIEQMLKQISDNPYFNGNLKGNRPNTEVLDYYKNNQVDIFINLSTSEGVPISIVEAMSYSIPIVATKVGGVSELVNEQTGCLVSKDFETIEVVAAIEKIVSSPNYAMYRENAYKHWEKTHNALTIYKTLVLNISNTAD